MSIQKKRLFILFLFICLGLAGIFILKKNVINPKDNSSEIDHSNDSIFSKTLLSDFFDMENSADACISSDKFYSGNKSCKLSPSIEYGSVSYKIMDDIPTFYNLKSISITYKCSPEKENADALFVLSIEDSTGKTIFWDGKPIAFKDTNQWYENEAHFTIASELINSKNKIAVYPWNPNKKEFYVDDVRINYIGTAVYYANSLNTFKNTNLFFDFESETELSASETIKETIAHSGKKASDLSGIEFGPSLKKTLGELGPEMPKKISMSAWIYSLSDDPNALLTVSVIDSKNEPIFWEGKSTENKSFLKNKWTKLNASFILPTKKLNPDDILTMGVWNKGKTDIIIDDLEIVIGEGPERRETSIDKEFAAEKNKPPFRTIYFEKQEINNKNTTSITPFDKKNITDHFSPNDEFLVGDFFHDNYTLDDILCIKEKSQGLFTYSPETKMFKKLWENTNSADSLWNKKNNFYCGDFNSDGKADVLLVDKQTNDWCLLHFSGKNWSIILKGKNPKKEWITKKENAKEIIYPGNYSDGKKTFLKLTTDWRFDLKLIEQKSGESIVMGNIDFKGYPNDYNPKYFEFLKIVAGNFLSANKTSLLIVMCNCADADFSGKHCKKIDTLPFLPNSTQVYALPSPQISQIYTDKNKMKWLYK